MPLKTRGNLVHIARSAFRVEGHDLTNARAIVARPFEASKRISTAFTRMTVERFGRDPRENAGVESTVGRIASTLQATSQSRRPVLRRVMRPIERPQRRVILISGLHGCSHVFDRLEALLPRECEVIGWEHPGLDEHGSIPTSLHEFASVIAGEESSRSTGCPLEIIGYCIGGTIAHEATRLLLDSGVEVVRNIMIDSHPARSMREGGIPRKLQVLGPIELAKAKFKGFVEQRMVRIGIAQLKAMVAHEDRWADVELRLVRTGGQLAFGPLDRDSWADLARTVEFLAIPDVGHVELFRGRHEHRLLPALAD